MHDDQEYSHQHPPALQMKPKVRDIYDYIFPGIRYTGDSYIIDRINDDSMPVRITIGDNPELAKYNNCLINSIELHQAKSKKRFGNNGPTYHDNIYRILSVKHNSSDKPIDVSSDNILLTANKIFGKKAEIKEYKTKDLALPSNKKTKSRTSNKKEEKQERIIAILVNLLAKESIKAKSNQYIKGLDTINVSAISRTIVDLADEHGITSGLTSEESLATEINAFLTQYPNLKKL